MSNEQEMVEIFKSDKLKLSVSKFGQLKDPQSNICSHVQKFTWRTANHLTFEVITLDAAIVSLTVPDRNLESEEVLLASCETLDAYLQYDEQLLSSSVQSSPLKRRRTYSQRIWSPYVNGSDLILTNVILEECRNLMIRVRFSVAFNNVIRIGYEVVSDRVQPLDTSHRLVMNLGGKLAACFGTYDHVVQVDADRFCRVKGGRLRDGGVEKSIAEDLADLRVAQHVGMAVYRSESDGFDGVYKLGGTLDGGFNTRLIHARTGRVLEMYSDFGWLWFSTLNDLPNPAGLIEPFYASCGVKNVGQIFDMDRLVHSVVRFVEGDDPEPESVESLARTETVTESQVRLMIDDMLLRDLEEKILALKQAKILSEREAREIIEDLLIMSLGRMSESGLDVASIDEEGVRDLIEELMMRAISRTSLCKVSLEEEELDAEVTDEEGSSVGESAASEEVEEPKEVVYEYQKHGGILLHPSENLSLKRCKQKSVFSKTNYNRELVYKHNVLLKFGLCRETNPSSSNGDDDANKSNSSI